MSMTYARKPGDKTRRDLRHLHDLSRTASQHLPETTCPVTRPAASNWRAVTLRREVLAAVEALQARYAANNKDTKLTISEVLAAVLTAALPVLANKPEWR